MIAGVKGAEEMRKILKMCLTLVVCVVLLPMAAKAAGTKEWVRVAENDWVLQDAETGTDIEVKLTDNILYVKGKGAIPDYPKDSLGYRPWNGKTIYEIFIEKGITSVGAEAFSNLAEVNKVTLPSSIFIEDTTAFGGLHEGCPFYFYGTDIVSRNIGNIPYNNIDSILPTLQKYDNNYSFTFDNYYMVLMVQNGTSPKINNIAASDCYTQYYNPNFPLMSYDAEILTTGDLTIAYRRQGEAALEAFSIMLGDKGYAGMYNIYTKSGKDAKNDYLQNPIQMTVKIPSMFVYPGRTFSLVQILPGGIVQIVNDEDMDDNTLTFTTNYPITTYMLYYTDAGMIS